MSEEPRTLIDNFLAEQRQLTAVEEFSHAHDRGTIHESRYRHLLPLSAPRPGEQYAFEVNLDQCSGCKGCVTACHSLNGLDDGETWRDTGLLLGEMLVPSTHGGNEVIPLQQTVTTACHHCLEPGCLEGCPVLAYDKVPITGIVRHLDDQCIGCSYCILKCPYDVPKYSAKRGIVRKCDMCHGRLEAGEAPASVQACPNEAIKITVVETAAIRDASRNLWLADAPSAKVTLPTTRYITNRPPARMRSADHERVRPQHPHWPLILMLVFTQLGIGGSIVTTWGNLDHPLLSSANILTFGIGLFFSVFHLGQPLKAWRVWLGWRTSWLSREAMVLNAFAACLGWQVIGGHLPKWILLCAGTIAVFSQVMVYADTQRQFWAVDRSLPRFFGSVFVLGSATALAFQPSSGMALMLMAGTMIKLGCELAVLKYKDEDRTSLQLRRTAALQTGLLRPMLTLRLMLGLLGGMFIPFLFLTGSAGTSFLFASLLLCLGGELAERYLFFTSVAPDRMPGSPGS